MESQSNISNIQDVLNIKPLEEQYFESRYLKIKNEVAEFGKIIGALKDKKSKKYAKLQLIRAIDKMRKYRRRIHQNLRAGDNSEEFIEFVKKS